MPAKAPRRPLPVKVPLLAPVSTTAKPNTPFQPAEDLRPEQLTRRATLFTPELLALLTQSGHAESLLND
jgi:hypothetical protein